MSVIEFAVGQESSLLVSVTANDIRSFAELSGDYAPVHMDDEFARRVGFDGVLVHGAFLGALLSRFVGMQLPGSLAILERLDITFRKPCYAPVDLRITGRVAQISEAVATIMLNLSVQREEGDVVATAKSWHRVLEE